MLPLGSPPSPHKTDTGRSSTMIGNKRSNFFFLPLLVWACHFLTLADAHVRLECPPPRSGETGTKTGPCDIPNDELSLPAFPLIANSFNTITWVESISHPGAPARLALSFDGDGDDGYESCILLDHIPHDERSRPKFTDESTWHRSSITVYIPDIFCERCHLQLISIMSDEGHGVPPDTSCAYIGALNAGTVTTSEAEQILYCPAVYHSCAPVSINGTVPRNEIDVCDTTDFEQRLDWPFSADETPSVYFYKGNPGLYSQREARLQSSGFPIDDCASLSYCNPQDHYEERIVVPEDAKYTELAGFCKDIVSMEVEPFVLGDLPSTPKSNSSQSDVSNGESENNDNPCILCEPVSPCFSVEACLLRNVTTGNWTGEAELCNQFGNPCEECFSNSTCYLGLANDAKNDKGENDTTPESGCWMVSKYLPFVMMLIQASLS